MSTTVGQPLVSLEMQYQYSIGKCIVLININLFFVV